MEVDPEDVCRSLIGRTITGIEINEDTETINLILDRGFLEFTGDDLEMYVELPENNH